MIEDQGEAREDVGLEQEFHNHPLQLLACSPLKRYPHEPCDSLVGIKPTNQPLTANRVSAQCAYPRALQTEPEYTWWRIPLDMAGALMSCDNRGYAVIDF
jgi:hypothetical protein